MLCQGTLTTPAKKHYFVHPYTFPSKHLSHRLLCDALTGRRSLILPIRHASTAQFDKNPFSRECPKNCHILPALSEFIPRKEDFLDEEAHKEFHIALTPCDIEIQEVESKSSVECQSQLSSDDDSSFFAKLQEPVNKVISDELEAHFNKMKKVSLLGQIAAPKPIRLPKRKAELMKTLILDMDETLIHSFDCFINSNFYNGHYVHTISIEDSAFAIVQFIIRPYLSNLLDLISQKYEIIVFP